MEIKTQQNSTGEQSKFDLALKIINEFIVDNQFQHTDIDCESHCKRLIDVVYTGDLLGEEVNHVRQEMRPLYFGLKNIILKEIENIDKEIDVYKFFFEDQIGIQIPSQSLS